MDLYALGGLHGISFMIVAAVIVYSDHQAYLYFRGKKATLRESFVVWSHRLVWAGLLAMITTGIALTIPGWEYRLSNPVFYVKMGFVLVLIMNACAIGIIAKKATTTPFAELSDTDRRTLMVSGALSAIGWIGAALIGYFVL